MHPTRVFVLCAVVFAAAPSPVARGTWSIVLADAETKEIAVGTVTCLNDFDLLAVVPVVVVGTGAAAVQAAGDFEGIRRPVIFEQLMLGTPPQEILEMLEGFGGHQSRQYGIADTALGRVTFSGSQNSDWAGGVVGASCSMVYAVQGNILAGDCVVPAIEQAILDTAGDIPAKLMAGMQAARQAAGDGRCSCSPSNPTSCGCPPDVFNKSGHIGGMIVARIGDTDDPLCDAAGCADGDYFMRMNVAFQGPGEPDPVDQLQAQFDAWRGALAGRPDGVQSTVQFDPPDIPPDGASTTTMYITLLDWTAAAVTEPVESLAVEHAPTSAGNSAIGAVIAHGGGVYSVTLTAGTSLGLDRFAVTADDGVRPVTLMPDALLEYCDPGQCTLDCNGNGVADTCDIGGGSSLDCNANLVPDECDVATTSEDCNDDLVPDECEPDCNDNSTADACDISGGQSTDVDGNGVPDECHAILRVPSQYATIQAGIDAALAGDTVWLADGTYTDQGNRDLDLGGKNVLVKSENGPLDCVIDCQGGGRGFIFQSGEEPTAAVDGLTITGGLADRGGAVLCLSGSKPTIRNCVLTGNAAEVSGGALYSEGSAPLITQCTITANAATSGGALYFVQQDSAGFVASIANCFILGNTSDSLGGGVVALVADIKIRDSIIAHNAANLSGGGVAVVLSEAELRGCTITANDAQQRGGAIYAAGSTATTLSNCILWNDTAPEGPEIFLGAASAEMGAGYCDVAGGASGVEGAGTLMWAEGDVDADPLFVDADGGDGDPHSWQDNDYHLAVGSPCIDAGDNNFVEDYQTDIDGQSRIAHGVVDMGADEFRSSCPADLDGDGQIDAGDLEVVIAGWGPCEACAADVNADGTVNAIDLAFLLAAWGVCN